MDLNNYMGLISLISAIFTFLLVAVAFSQLHKFNKQIRADFTLRIYKDLLAWLDNKKEVRDWIFEDSDSKLLKYDKWEFDEFLSIFESLWTLYKKGLIDKDIVYDLFSDFIITVYEKNNFELKQLIEDFRKEESDYYIGVEKLYLKMKTLQCEKYEKI